MSIKNYEFVPKNHFRLYFNINFKKEEKIFLIFQILKKVSIHVLLIKNKNYI